MNKNYLFPVSIGLSDGIITALILASGGILIRGSIDLFEAFKISFGSAFAGAFSYFIAQYAGLNEELHRTALQLNLKSTDYLLRGHLGIEIFSESLVGALIAALFGFLGALIPLSSSLIIKGNIVIPLSISYFSLAVLGLFISKTTAGRARFWVIVMVIVGIIVTVAGYELKLIV
jgi:VIT1/CCC1 family predicted Fe2+/Mn2+ transporter